MYLCFGGRILCIKWRFDGIPLPCSFRRFTSILCLELWLSDYMISLDLSSHVGRHSWLPRYPAVLFPGYMMLRNSLAIGIVVVHGGGVPG